METNELPEEVRRIINDACNHMRDEFMTIDEMNQWRNGAEFGYRLALQSKEEEIANLKEQAGFALEIESQMQLRIEHDIAEIEKRDKSWNSLKLKSDQQIKRLEAKIDSLTSEVERLKAERESRAEHKRLNDEIAQLTKPKEELTKEVERLMGALSGAKEVIKKCGYPDTAALIDSLLSQSTDKQP